MGLLQRSLSRPTEIHFTRQDPSEVVDPKGVVMATTPILSSDVVEEFHPCDKPWELKRECTVPEVRKDAEKVLDIFIKRSLSMNDASPKRRYMIKVRRQQGRGRTISKYSDIAEETAKFSPTGRASFRNAVQNSCIDSIEADGFSASDEEGDPKSNSAPASLRYRVQLKPTEETLKKIERIQARQDRSEPSQSKTSKKKKHSFSSLARSIQTFLKSPSIHKKKHDFTEEEKKEKEREKEHKKSSLRTSFRKKFTKKRKSSKKLDDGSQESILTPSSATSGGITPSSLSSNDILETDNHSRRSKNYKKYQGYGDAETPDSISGIPITIPNGEVIYGGPTPDNSHADLCVDLHTSEDRGARVVIIPTRDLSRNHRHEAYRTQKDNKRESKESEKMKDEPDYGEEFPMIYNGRGSGSDEPDGLAGSKFSDSGATVHGPTRPRSLNLQNAITVDPVGLNGITEALELGFNRDLRIRHVSTGDGQAVVTRIPAGALPSDVVIDGGSEGVDSNRYYYIIEGLKPGLILIPAEDISSEEEYKPFTERTAAEKDQLYEKIAKTLARIGDTIAVDHELGESTDLIGAVGGGGMSPDKKEIEKEEEEIRKVEENFTETDARNLGIRLREHGDRRSSSEILQIPLNVLISLAKNTTYDSFKGVAQTMIGEDTSVRELALVFKLTKDVLKVAGKTPAVVRKVRDNALTFLNDRFAEWISQQGGWGSVVDVDVLKSSSEEESEVD
ncbi:uncharacterized protein LOC144453011 isoform X2 [Glandiceps talaboti]